MSVRTKLAYGRAALRAHAIQQARADIDDAEDRFMARGGRAALAQLSDAYSSMREIARGEEYADFDVIG